jgi:hypothetical protein
MPAYAIKYYKWTFLQLKRKKVPQIFDDSFYMLYIWRQKIKVVKSFHLMFNIL